MRKKFEMAAGRIVGLVFGSVLALGLTLTPTLLYADWNSAKKALQKEPKIKSYSLEDSTLYVGVVDDGSNRTGYAMYLCEVLNEHKVADGTAVKIIDRKNWQERENSKFLGYLICNNKKSLNKAIAKNRSNAKQKKMEAFINEFKDNGIIYKIEDSGEYVNLWVNPVFQGLDFDSKKMLVNLVYSYFSTKNKNFRSVYLLESRNGKKIGSYSEGWGLSLK